MSDTKLSRRQILKLGAGTAIAGPVLLEGCSDSPPAIVPADAQIGVDAKPVLIDAGPLPDADQGIIPDQTIPDSLIQLTPLAISQDDQRFSLAVQAGAMSQTSALLWTYAENEAPTRLRVWQADEDPISNYSFDQSVVHSDGYFKISVDGLSAGTWYAYAFFTDDEAGQSVARSAAGRFKTAPLATSEDVVTIAATTCTKTEDGPFKALSTMADYDYDVVCHTGDISYNDGAVDLDGFRKKWKETLADPGYKSLFAKAGMYLTWDDHEITNNTWRPVTPQSVFDAGADAFFETLAIPRIKGNQLWTSYVWGKTVEFIILDCRGERTSDKYISDDQMNWLLQRLAQSPCHFKMVFNSVPITEMPAIWLAKNDRWQGNPVQRDQLLNFITDNQLNNVWFLSGDFHVGLVSKVETTGPRSSIREILPGPGAHSPNPLWTVAKGSSILMNQVAPADQFAHFDGRNAATLLTFDPAKNAVRIRFIDPDTKATWFDEWVTAAG
jgi:phosphodiesterase/alkaline phosphatase D-like protein